LWPLPRARLRILGATCLKLSNVSTSGYCYSTFAEAGRVYAAGTRLLMRRTSVTIVGLLVSSKDPALTSSSGTANASPFVIAIKNAGIGGLPSVRDSTLISGLLTRLAGLGYQRGITDLGLVGGFERLVHFISCSL
jgi:hypothetical protein